MKYILEGKEIKPVDVLEWACWMESSFGNFTHPRFLGRTEINGLTVSTVFLGIDHSWGRGDPILFETMILPLEGLNEEYQERYCTYDEAMEGHQKAVEYVKSRKSRKSAIVRK